MARLLGRGHVVDSAEVQVGYTLLDGAGVLRKQPVEGRRAPAAASSPRSGAEPRCWRSECRTDELPRAWKEEEQRPGMRSWGWRAHQLDKKRAPDPEEYHLCHVG